MSVRVGVVGVNAHGRWHLDNLARLAADGIVELAAACDVAPVDDATRSLIARLGAPLYTSYEEMLATAAPDLVVLVTPPATHLPLARAAMMVGADVLVEKPATVRLADLDDLTETAAALGRLVQIGFQSTGSYAIEHIARHVGDGTLGRLRHVFAAGAWTRPRSYFLRSAWAGRRFLDGIAVGDGAVANPFGHALMNCLEIAGVGTIGDAEFELFHANDIESDDTSSVRLAYRDITVNLAVTLCADRVVEPYVVAVGEHGMIRWDYTPDEIRLNGNPIALPRARDLLVDLIDARAAGRTPICPPQRCRAFTAVTEQLLDARSPAPIQQCHRLDGDTVVVPGVADVVEDAAATGRLFSETGVAWACA